MREILFRGKKVHSDKWLYGVPVKGTEKDVNEMIMIASVFDQEGYCCRGCNLDPVIPETIGQFTGLTDKNGKKIFEGDILEITERGVTARGGVVRFEYGYAGGWVVCDPQKETSHCTLSLRKDVEVIGNIHDNPELIEVKA